MSNLFFRNRRLLVLTLGLILVAGFSSIAVMPRMEDPVMTERFATIHTLFPGADADRVEALVTQYLEDELQEIEEIKEVRSFSRREVSSIALELHDEIYDVDEVWSRVRDKLGDVQPLLPRGAHAPRFELLDVKAYAMIVALTWDQPGTTNYAILRRLAEQLEDRLRATSGTEDVDVYGDPDEEIVVRIRPAELAQLGLTAQEVASQVAASDAKVAAGQLRSDQGDLLLEVSGELDSLARIASLPVHYGSEGRVVQLGDIAEVSKGIAEPAVNLSLIDGKPAVALGVLVRVDQRIDVWHQRAGQVLAAFGESVPRGVTLSTVFNQNRYVTERLETLLGNLFVGALAVSAVIFVLMGWRSALVVGSALPLSALMVVSGLRFLEVPIHQMSVTGLIIALGLLIDNAIVVVDEVNGRLSKGLSPAEAISQTIRHLAVPLFGSTLTTALAFAPLALMAGPAGEFVGSIAVSVILAICSSFLLAMTIIPTLAALGRRAAAALQRRAWWRDGFHHALLARWYRRSLQGIFKRPVLGVLLGLILPVAGFIQARHLPLQFFPPADRDQFHVELELPVHASLPETMALVKSVRSSMLEHPRVRKVHWFLGQSVPTFYYNVVRRRENMPGYAQALVQLDRAESCTEVIRSLQKKLDRQFPGARILVRQLEQGPPFDAPVELRLFGPDLERLRALGDELRLVLSETPQVIHTRSELSEPLPKIALNVDEEQARLAGLDHLEIASQLHSTLEGAVGGSVLEATEELPVRVRLDSSGRAELAKIASLDLLPKQQGAGPRQHVPLSALAEIGLTAETASIPRMHGRRMNEVQAYLASGVLPAPVLADFQERLAASGFELPPGYSMSLGGEADERQQAIRLLMANLGVLLVLMVATLVLSFGSFRMAALIGSVAVLSIGLGTGALWLYGYPFGFMAIVGTMGLIGVAINDSIVVLAALRDDEAARRGDPAAVREVVVHCTRHIVATSLTTMAGFAPLLIGGGGFWPPLAVAIAGGVAGATILALYYIPSAYMLVMCRGCDQQRELEDSFPSPWHLEVGQHLESAETTLA